VVEERVYDSTVMVANLANDVLVSYTQNKTLSEAARKQLERIVEQKRRISEADAEARRLETESNELTKDQARLRQNIESLNRVSGQQEQVQKYARDLAAQESRLATLRDQLSETRKRKAALDSELNSLIEKVEF
jgi:chromosome segregation ATPase